MSIFECLYSVKAESFGAYLDVQISLVLFGLISESLQTLYILL